MDLICLEDISERAEIPGSEACGDDRGLWPTAEEELRDGGNHEHLEYLFAQEKRYRPRDGYLELLHNSSVIDSDVRERMVAYIMKTQEAFGFSMYTASLAVNYMDRFFSSFTLSEDKKWVLELATTACISIAAKMDEVKTYTLTAIQECCEPEHTVFEAATVARMELLVLDVLQWELNAVTPVSYLDRFVLACGFGDVGGGGGKGWVIRRQAHELIRSSFSEVDCMRFSPATLAAACVLHSIEEHGGARSRDAGVAREMSVLLQTTQTHPRVLRNCVRVVERLLTSGRSLQSPVTVLPV